MGQGQVNLSDTKSTHKKLETLRYHMVKKTRGKTMKHFDRRYKK